MMYSNTISVMDAVQEGLLKLTTLSNQDYYECQLCLKSMSGVVPARAHLIGDKHKKMLRARETVESPRPSRLDYDNLPSSTMNSCPVTSNTIAVTSIAKSIEFPSLSESISGGTVTSTIVGSQKVLICTVCKINCNGEAPMEQHLKGDVHLKKMRRLMEGGVSGTSGQPGIPFQKSHLVREYPTAGSTTGGYKLEDQAAQDILETARKDGIVRSANDGDPSHLLCQLCESVCSGEEPMRQHLRGKPHQKKHRLCRREDSPAVRDTHNTSVPTQLPSHSFTSPPESTQFPSHSDSFIPLRERTPYSSHPTPPTEQTPPYSHSFTPSRGSTPLSSRSVTTSREPAAEKWPWEIVHQASERHNPASHQTYEADTTYPTPRYPSEAFQMSNVSQPMEGITKFSPPPSHKKPSDEDTLKSAMDSGILLKNEYGFECLVCTLFLNGESATIEHLTEDMHRKQLNVLMAHEKEYIGCGSSSEQPRSPERSLRHDTPATSHTSPPIPAPRTSLFGSSRPSERKSASPRHQSPPYQGLPDDGEIKVYWPTDPLHDLFD